MRFEIDQHDIDLIAEKVTARIMEQIEPLLLHAKGGQSAPRLVTLSEAARLLGRTTWAVRHMIRENKIGCIRDGRRVFIERKAVDAWVDQMKAETKVAS